MCEKCRSKTKSDVLRVYLINYTLHSSYTCLYSKGTQFRFVFSVGSQSTTKCLPTIYIVDLTSRWGYVFINGRDYIVTCMVTCGASRSPRVTTCRTRYVPVSDQNVAPDWTLSRHKYQMSLGGDSNPMTGVQVAISPHRTHKYISSNNSLNFTFTT